MLAHHPAVASAEPPDSSSSSTTQPISAPTDATHSSQSSIPTTSSQPPSKPPSNKLNSILSAYDSGSGSGSDSDSEAKPQPPSTKRSRSEPTTTSDSSPRAAAATSIATESHNEATFPTVGRRPAVAAPFRPFDAAAVESDSDEDVVGPADALLGPDLTHILGSSLGAGSSTAFDTSFSFPSEPAFVGPARPTDLQSYSYPEYGSATVDAVEQSGHAVAAPATAAKRVPAVLRRMMEERPEAVLDVSVPAKLASDAELLKQITSDEQTRQWMSRFSHGPDSRAKLALEANPDLADAQHGTLSSG